MNRRLRWRIAVTLVVTLGLSIFAWYPMLADRAGLPNPEFMRERRPRLGLDLRGGVHMVLRVNTDDAVALETRRAGALSGAAIAAVRADTVRQARETIERRVNALGVAEPIIAIQGAAADEILVQLPGIGDMDRA